MGYQRHTTDFKLARLKRYFTSPMKPVRNLSVELGDELYAFLSDERVPMDNNLAERAVKPFVIGRKNFLFFKAKAGPEASATMMTVIRAALRNGLIPERYLA